MSEQIWVLIIRNALHQETQADFEHPDFTELSIDFKVDDSTNVTGLLQEYRIKINSDLEVIVKDWKQLFIQKIIRIIFSHKKLHKLKQRSMNQQVEFIVI